MLLPFHDGWRPRDYQLPLWEYLELGGRNAVEVAHRRWGKDDVFLRWASVAAYQRVGTYWHMLPEAKQARKAIWDAVNPNSGRRRIDEAFPQAIRANTNNTEMFIRFTNGSTWQVVGSDNYNSLVGSPPIGVTFSEWSLANPLALAYIDPILIENGGWKAFIYTPRGKNHGHSLLQTAKTTPHWFAQVSTVDDTGRMTEEMLQAALATYTGLYGDDMGLAFFEQEYYCSFEAAILGAIYGGWIRDAERDGRMRGDIFDPALPVNTAWDLGFGDATVVWFWQMLRNEVRVIDFYQNWGKDVKHYTDKLKDLAKERGFKYGTHYAPTDATRKVLEAGGKSVLDQAREEGVRLTVVHPTVQINQIAAARKTLRHAYFDATRCAKGIEALRSYRYLWDEKRKQFNETPYHDWSSHPADGFEIIAQVWRSIVGNDEDDKPKIRVVTEEMWKRLRKERFPKGRR